MPTKRQKGPKAHLENQAKAFGCPDLISLTDEPSANHLDYLDLLPGKMAVPLSLDAVAEFQGRPVLYFVDGINKDLSGPSETIEIQNLQQLLANRSEQACLGIIRPGSLDIYPINLDRKTLEKAAPRIINVTSPEAPTFFQSLVNGTLAIEGQPKEADSVFHEIHSLLERASDALIGKLEPLEVLSVTGRALFYRFLLDRHIILKSELEEICPGAKELEDAFSDAESAARTSCWLDQTFNGDLLPLVPNLSHSVSSQERHSTYLRFYRRAGTSTNGSVFLHLQAILRGWESLKNSNFQLRLPQIDWHQFNFAHIPIGVLSQVYETFSRQWDEKYAEQTSVYYTPKHIARCLVEEAFGGLKDPAEAHVLDPACGAGIFLVLAFRRLVRARWEKDEQRPDTRTIQHTLYNQVRGFDVSESALRLSALALYITAIELNGSPRPPKTLKFPRDLKEHVLFNFGEQHTERERNFELGSLGSNVPLRFNGVFDVVVANPPWTRLRVRKDAKTKPTTDRVQLEALNREFTSITQRVLKSRNLETIAAGYTNPDFNPDLPFIWRATEWAKEGGIIAMALPSRILIKQSLQGKSARNALLKGLTVTGIINCSNLEQTRVWPNMALPFMMFFAKNVVPRSEHQFVFATPVRERQLNDRGLFRLDYQAAEAVSARSAIEKTWLLKALSIGTSLDVAIMDGLMNLGWDNVGQFWSKAKLYSGKGYDLSPALTQYSAKHLLDLLDFQEPAEGFRIEYTKLNTWQENRKNEAEARRREAERTGEKIKPEPCNTAHMPRSERLFQPSLLIVPQSPGPGRDVPKSYRSLERSICFSQSYYGFSAAGHRDSKVIISLLHLITHSLLFNYFCLMVSSRLGAERRTFIKVDLEVFPFPDPDKLTDAQKRRLLVLSDALDTQTKKPWQAIDTFIYELFGLDHDDYGVVCDTITVGAPYQSAREPAELPPNSKQAELFRAYLEEMLQPSFEVMGQQISVTALPTTDQHWNSPWRFVAIAIKGDKLPSDKDFLTSLMEQANRAAASRVVMRVPKGGLLLGLLNQRRFWTESRARLCGLHLLREHLNAFPFTKVE